MTEIHHNFCWVITGYNWKWVSSYKLDSSSLSNGNKAKKVHVCGIQWKMEITLFSIWYIYSLIKSQKLFFLSFLPKVYKYINLVFGPFLQNGISYEMQQLYSTYPINVLLSYGFWFLYELLWKFTKWYFFLPQKVTTRFVQGIVLKLTFIVSPS